MEFKVYLVPAPRSSRNKNRAKPGKTGFTGISRTKNRHPATLNSELSRNQAVEISRGDAECAESEKGGNDCQRWRVSFVWLSPRLRVRASPLFPISNLKFQISNGKDPICDRLRICGEPSPHNTQHATLLIAHPASCIVPSPILHHFKDQSPFNHKRKRNL